MKSNKGPNIWGVSLLTFKYLVASLTPKILQDSSLLGPLLFTHTKAGAEKVITKWQLNLWGLWKEYLLWDPQDGMRVYKECFWDCWRLGHFQRKVAEAFEEKANILELAGVPFFCLYLFLVVIICRGIFTV